MIRVLLVDDHRVVTDGLRLALETDEDVEVVGMVGTHADARAAIIALSPDVAIVDIRLPDRSGLELVRHDGQTRYLVLSTFGGPAYIEAAFRLGARGFFLETCPTAVLLAGIKRIAAGGTAFDPDAMQSGSPTSWRALSEREHEVVRLVTTGRSNDEIAAELGIARKTVEAHLSRLFSRFNVMSRTELALKADREGWLDVPADRSAAARPA